MPAALPGRRAPSTPRARGNCHHTKRRTPIRGAQPTSRIRPDPGHTSLRLIDPQWSASSATSDHSLAAGLAIGLGYA